MMKAGFNDKQIGIAGNARAGKDTLGLALENALTSLGIKAKRQSFALALKQEVDEFLLRTLGISAFTTDDEEKQKIRPFLVWWGTEFRRKDDNDFWVKEVQHYLFQDRVTILTDMRFRNEFDAIKAGGGKTIFVTRLDANGVEVPPANEYERENNVFLSQNADFNLTWPTTSDKKIIDGVA